MTGSSDNSGGDTIDTAGQVEGTTAETTETTPAVPADTSSETLARNPAIAAKFNEIFGTADGAGDGAAETVEPATPPSPAGDQTGVQPPPLPVPNKQPVQQPAAAAKLDPSLARAAALSGWEPADVDAFYQANPDLATRTFTKFQEQYNNLTQEYARLGQATVTPPPAAPDPVRPPTSSPTSRLDALLTDVALKEFGENNGQDFVEKFLVPFKAEVLAPLREAMAHVTQQKAEVTAKQVTGVFGDFEKAGFADLYGKTGQVSPEQNHARFQVAQLADQILFGAKAQGQDMAIPDALERAHLLFTANRQAEMSRRQVAQQVQRRSAGITQRPTQRRTPSAAEGGGRSVQAAMSAYQQKAAELGMNLDAA